MTKSVQIIGNSFGVQSIFIKRGFKVIHGENSKTSPDLICFTGGADINPALYGEEPLAQTKPDRVRDAKEILAYERFLDTPKVGICRGGQLLNALSGGEMWQDVDGHKIAHETIDLLFTRDTVLLPSGHHQMMIKGADGFVLAVAYEAKVKKSPSKRVVEEYDAEVIWYPKTKSLCYQSHPEWEGIKSNGYYHVDYFFDLITWAFDL